MFIKLLNNSIHVVNLLNIVNRSYDFPNTFNKSHFQFVNIYFAKDGNF